ncbi:MAG: tRNA (adenosine(37)-N6)-dimethylallyltransferase MiaA [Verrucomicrobiaceae bacterium]|nr:tRNA (adenosine(37)-N6)-dimethylallyltransferase MiaA [Verrucomicrobiaceae bacterium]
MPSPLYIVGPTASGKSAVALALAERIGGEIVNADAFQLYRKLDIVTAKPTAQERARVPHHLYDVLDPSENCDAQRYREMAMPLVAEIGAGGRVPIVVGGSGLYLKALTHGLAELPRGDESLRAQFDGMTLEEKTTWLLQLDPNAGMNVNLRNPRYVERALEVCLLTGLPQSELRQTFGTAQPDARGVFLAWDRTQLYERINQRVRSMIEAGLVEEVRRLSHESDLSDTSEKAIGIREVRAFLSGQCTLEAAIDAMQQATRRYAKRQMTWFRRETWLQTICLAPETTADSTTQMILELFPDLKP